MMAREFVVLLHGILRSPVDMIPLSVSLKRSGYDTLNILYPSRRKSLAQLVEFIHGKITADRDYSPGKTLHFVTHSMGGLIARYYIAAKKPQNLGKVVMLGPPNTGSEFADFLTGNRFFSPGYKILFGPAGQQLITAYKHTDGAVHYPLGVIAGSRSINPLAPWGLKNIPVHDGIVPAERTKIAGMAAHIVLPVNHTFMMFSPRVIRQVKYFLKNGTFEA